MAYRSSFEALGDPTRRRIFEILRSGPHAVGDIAREVPVSRPAVSQHLRVLKDAGLVSDRRDGARRIYQVDLQGLADLRAYVESFWDLALDGYRVAAESPEERRRR